MRKNTCRKSKIGKRQVLYKQNRNDNAKLNLEKSIMCGGTHINFFNSWDSV